jgi:hypothetical protein
MAKTLDKWLHSSASIAGANIAIENAVASDLINPYFYYRLRNFFLLQGIFLFTHLLEFFFLYRLLPHSHLKNMMIVFSTFSLLQAFWWGGLECLRMQMRKLRAYGVMHKGPNCFCPWMNAAYSIVSIFIILLIGLFSYAIWSGAYDTYLLSIFAVLSLRFIFFIVVSTAHSTIYSISRIYMPVPYLAGVELVSLLLLCFSIFFFGSWGLPVSAIIYTCGKNAIKMHYILRAYKSYGWSLPLFTRRTFKRGLKIIISNLKFSTKYCLYGLAALFMGIDLPIIFAILHEKNGGHSAGILTVTAVFMISPLLRSTHAWAYLFYFDLIKLDQSILKKLKNRFYLYLNLLSVAMAVVFASLALLFIYFRSTGNWLQQALVIYPLFLVISLFAFAQIKAFCNGCYLSLIGSGLVLSGSCLWLTAMPEKITIPGLLSCFVISFLYLIIVSFEENKRKCRIITHIFSQWLFYYRRASIEQKILKLIFCDKSEYQARADILQTICEGAGANLVISYIGYGTVIAIGSSDQVKKISDLIAIYSAGNIVGHQILSIPCTWEDKVELLYSENIITTELKQNLLSEQNPGQNMPINHEAISRHFLEIFPDGSIVNLEDPDKKTSYKIARSYLTKNWIIPAALHFAKYFEYHNSEKIPRISVFCPNGEIKLVFLVPFHKANPKALKYWKNYVVSYSLFASGTASN